MDIKRAQQIKDLMIQGMSSRQIASALGIGKSTAAEYMKRLRIGNLPDSNLKKKVEAFSDKSQVEAARALNMGSNAIRRWKEKLSGENCIIDSELRKDLSKGAKLSFLRNKYGISTIEELPDVIADVFPAKMLHYVQETPNGDSVIVVMADSTGQFEWLDKKEPARFKYFQSPDKNYIYVQFDKDLPEQITVYNLTDLHIGSKHCRTELLKQHIKMIAEDDSAFAFLGGDIFDFMHKLSTGQPWEQNLAPMEQVACAARMLMPIAHKILLYVSGNHDRDRGYRFVGADLAKCLADLLKVPYSHIENTIDLEFKSNLFTAILHHGAGGGGSIQSIMRDAEKYRTNTRYFVHWHMSGHVHNAFVKGHEDVIRTPGKGLNYARSYTVIGGSYMKRTGSYAEEARFSGEPQDLTAIVMNESGAYGAVQVPVHVV